MFINVVAQKAPPAGTRPDEDLELLYNVHGFGGKLVESGDLHLSLFVSPEDAFHFRVPAKESENFFNGVMALRDGTAH